MAQEKSFLDELKNKGTDAAYRVAAKQTGEAVHKVLMDALQKKGGDNGAIVAAMADNEIGKAFVMYALGAGLERAPFEAAKGAKAQRLASELQVGGMEVVGNAAVGAVMQEVLPLIISILSGLPEVPENARVATDVPAQLTEGGPSAEEELQAPAVPLARVSR